MEAPPTEHSITPVAEPLPESISVALDEPDIKDDDEDEPKKRNNKADSDDLSCKWTDCPESQHTNLPSLVRHLNNQHLNYTNSLTVNTPTKYSCLWEGCARYGVEQPSRFALISHCRTHTGEKPYFCPIPECEKHFTRSDALAKHVKGVHDLHILRDAVTLNRDRVKKGRMEANFLNQDKVTELEFLSMIEDDYELRVPWWFSNDFLNIVSDSSDEFKTLYRIPLTSKQYRIAMKRYQSYYHEQFEDNDTKLPPQLKNAIDAFTEMQPEDESEDTVIDLGELQKLHQKLSNQLSTSQRVNKIATKQLTHLVDEKRKLWYIKEVLLDANAKLSIPIRSSDKDAGQPDKYDDELYDSIKTI